jgi:hypothetical protein
LFIYCPSVSKNGPTRLLAGELGVGNTSEKEVIRLTSVCHRERVRIAVEKRGGRSGRAGAGATEKRMKEELERWWTVENVSGGRSPHGGL